ncbi:Neurogenic locus notch 3 [Chionoecetes opilio]|uniref:Neurogenic locus notch 3 n=1 Tax=Chionoecetes opilio TaxID=41210 RepID=A0A8J4Y3N6_CHIOP|nr:Neurogenic locus notch 3 [Chionoecetes opilio]
MRLLVAVVAVLVSGTAAQCFCCLQGKGARSVQHFGAPTWTLAAVFTSTSVDLIIALPDYASAPLRPIAPYRYSSPERVVYQGRISTGGGFGGSSRTNPCSPTPCGPNTRCEVNQKGIAQCRCLANYVPKGNTIVGCEPQCTIDDDCPDDHRCQGQQCVKVCQTGACGAYADCSARNHRADCKCPKNYIGDPHTRCTLDEPEDRVRAPAPYTNPCERFPAPCGTEANCREEGDRPVCSCPLGYEGNPLERCIKGECLENNECPKHRVCQGLKCVDPCTYNDRPLCGRNAECKTKNHQPICSCPERYIGDPFNSCRIRDDADICAPNTCGRNTDCKVRNDRAVCSCIGNYIGDPLTGCQPECSSDSECGPSRGCRDNICVNPCAYDACGENAYCDVKNGRAVCSCPEHYQGDGYSRCYAECTKHSDCSSNKGCIKFRCVNPCTLGPCGVQADCNAANHTAICSCPKTHTGDPFEACRPFSDADYCTPNPCGTNADCQVGFDRSGEKRPVCTCPSGYIGNPKYSCNPGECTQSNECPKNRACYMFQCMNPCYYSHTMDRESVCGENADCYVENHAPTCSCPPGYIGDPTRGCSIDDRRRSGSNRYNVGYSK